MNRDFDEELGRSRQDGRRRETGSTDSRAEHSGGRRGETGSGAFQNTAATEPDTERQELITAVNRSCGRRENAVSCGREGRVSLKPFLEEQNAASEARSAQDGAEAGQQPPEAEAHVRRREGNSPLRQDKAPVRLRQEQTGCLPEFRRRFRRKRGSLPSDHYDCCRMYCSGSDFRLRFCGQNDGKDSASENFNMDSIATNEISEDVAEQMKGYWTIALFGVDSRGNVVTKGTNADVNMICNINRDTGEIKLVSVYRDTYLNVSKEGTYNKLNYAYAVGGPEQAIETLNRNLVGNQRLYDL